MSKHLPLLALGTALFLAAAQPFAAEAPAQPAASRELAKRILADEDLRDVLARAKALLKTGLNAGSGYGEVWIRDLNTFIELSLEVNEPQTIRHSLVTFFKFQGPQGDIVDGYIPTNKASIGYKYRRSDLAPEFVAHKNTVETDQEASLVQAIRKYVRVTGDRALLDERVAGQTVRERLRFALDYLLKERFDAKHGLIWGATTVDWGDVQPEHEWGVELDAQSHRAIDIYDNAMFLVAIEDYLTLAPGDPADVKRWQKTRDEFRARVQEKLWDRQRQKYRPHLYLEGSPFPKDFDEDAIGYHGGTAVAIEAGLLNPHEIAASLALMRANVKAAKASSIGLTVYPPYPQGYFKNKGLGPCSYQNGGDWCWFGGRMIQQLVRNGFVEEAYTELLPMVQRVRKHNGFYEWWTPDNQPRGSGQFRGSAGVLGRAIEMLQAWAEAQGK